MKKLLLNVYGSIKRTDLVLIIKPTRYINFSNLF